jgi:formate hydrogenlyase subunit 4
LIQPIADGLKLLLKEIVVPTGANKGIFLIAPMLAIAPALAAWAVVPFTDSLVLANIDASLLYIMAVTRWGYTGSSSRAGPRIPSMPSSGPCARLPRWFPTKSRWASR